MKILQTSSVAFNHLTKNGTDMGEFTHIISICCPDDNIKPINKNHLVIKIWDVDEDLENKFRKYKAPTEKDLQPIVNNVSKWIEKYGWNLNILIHCDAGISRSTAIALACVWYISSFFFASFVYENCLKDYIRVRKEFCASLIETRYDKLLKWYIEGKNLMRGAKPNQAILKYYRKTMHLFPW